jgi:hypothetical protein
MTRCRRCDWHANPEDETTEAEQLAQHSLDAAHPLCICCNGSLPPAEGMTCDRCLTTARQHLAGILLMFDELPSHMGHARSPLYDSDRPTASDGAPLPGGDALVLLGPGSEGLAEDGVTSREGDVSSVAFELGWWEQAWREDRGEAITGPPRSTSAVVRSAGSYLEVHSRWAATTFEGFDDFTADLRRIHSSLERATGRHDRRIIAEAECFDCGGDLIREMGDRGPDEDRPVGLDHLDRPFALGRAEEGYADTYTCAKCGRRYEWHAYLLALSQVLSEADLPEWSPVAMVAERFGLNPGRVWKWKQRGLHQAKREHGQVLVRLVCDVEGAA